jgi:hypothetical protein
MKSGVVMSTVKGVFVYPAELIKEAAETLSVDVPSVRAVVAVESSGLPFNPPDAKTPQGRKVGGFPTIRFETEVFWKRLGKINPLRLVLQNTERLPDFVLEDSKDFGKAVLRKDWYKPLGKGDYWSWDYLETARIVNYYTANESTSWGAFQVMGFNYKYAGFKDVGSFVGAQRSLEGQFSSFVSFIKNNPAIHKALAKKNWAAFAKLYNGPGYRKNDYDGKMARFYNKFKSEKL